MLTKQHIDIDEDDDTAEEEIVSYLQCLQVII